MARVAVEAGVELDEGLEVLAALERREAVAVDADDLGRHALADLGLVARLGEDHEAAVAVQVDEARGDDLAGGVDACAPRGRAAAAPAGSSRIRSPSTTSGARAARAPVPSTIVPPRDQELDAVAHRTERHGPVERGATHAA